jgi:hypothetical protein
MSIPFWPFRIFAKIHEDTGIHNFVSIASVNGDKLFNNTLIPIIEHCPGFSSIP